MFSDIHLEDEFILTETALYDQNNHSFTVSLSRTLSGHNFVISPLSETHLFKPASMTFEYDGLSFSKDIFIDCLGECSLNIATFNAEIGKFFTVNVLLV